MYKFLLFLLFGITTNCFAGFCDSAWGRQKITSILIHNSVAYVTFEPGLNNGNDATDATVKNEAALPLTEENQKNIYPLLLTSFAAQKDVAMMYCDGAVTHGYKGGSNTVVKLRSVRVYE